MPEPKARSATWLSSTYAVDDESPEAALCSGAYQVLQNSSIHALSFPAQLLSQLAHGPNHNCGQHRVSTLQWEKLSHATCRIP